MSVRLRQLTLVILVMVVLAVACGEDSTPASDVESPPTVSPLTVPTTSPLPTPAAQSSTQDTTTAIAADEAIAKPDYQPKPFADPAKDRAVVAGRVVARFGNKTTYESVILSAVYLALVMVNDDGVPVVASLNSTIDPSSSTDNDGYFMFTDVPPGQYGFIIYYGVTHYLIRDDAGEQMLITIEPNQTLDLGLIMTDLPDNW